MRIMGMEIQASSCMKFVGFRARQSSVSLRRCWCKHYLMCQAAFENDSVLTNLVYLDWKKANSSRLMPLPSPCVSAPETGEVSAVSDATDWPEFTRPSKRDQGCETSADPVSQHGLIWRATAQSAINQTTLHVLLLHTAIVFVTDSIFMTS